MPGLIAANEFEAGIYGNAIDPCFITGGTPKFVEGPPDVDECFLCQVLCQILLSIHEPSAHLMDHGVVFRVEGFESFAIIGHSLTGIH